MKMNKLFNPKLNSNVKILRNIFNTKSLMNELSKDVKKSANPRISNIGLTDLKVNKFEKVILVWGGKYKKLADVPNFINQSVLEKARNKARLKISLVMVLATLVGCVIMIISGKRAVERGESVYTLNEEFRKKLIEKARQNDK